jgi:hypothetical protein
VRLAFLLGLVLTGEAPAPSTPEAVRLSPLWIAGSGISGNMMTPWAAYEGGFFEKHGLLPTSRAAPRPCNPCSPATST